MTWDAYKPLYSEPRLRFSNYPDLLMGDSIGKINDDDSYTSYHIAEIDSDEITATLWNYDTNTFETVAKDEIHTWLKNDTPLDIVVSIHEFTILSENEQPIGIKFHGSGMQSKETITLLGQDEYSYCLRLAIQHGDYGNDITEPYYADEHIQHDDAEEFDTKVKTEMKKTLLEKTPLTEKQASTILYAVMDTFEYNAEQRINYSSGWELNQLVKKQVTQQEIQTSENISNLYYDLPIAVKETIENDNTLLYHSSNYK